MKDTAGLKRPYGTPKQGIAKGKPSDKRQKEIRKCPTIRRFGFRSWIEKKMRLPDPFAHAKGWV